MPAKDEKKSAAAEARDAAAAAKPVAAPKVEQKVLEEDDEFEEFEHDGALLSLSHNPEPPSRQLPRPAAAAPRRAANSSVAHGVVRRG